MSVTSKLGDEKKILHVMISDKFIPPFIDFMEEYFPDFGRHIFFISEDNKKYPVRIRQNILFGSDYGKYRRVYELVRQMNHAEKIILHGLFNDRVVQLLALQPWLLKKCYWVIWGGDLYWYKFAKRSLGWYKVEIFRRFVIKRLGYLVTYIEGDVDLARQWYGARGQYHECLMYPSNLYTGYETPPKTDATINIQIGNSADPSNEHFEMLELLARFKDENIRIYAPLSYGDPAHALKVAEAGKRLFGEKFVALIDFMPFDEYLEFLGKIDIAIFNHRRQQAMGNTITLLGLRKKVYMRDDVTSKAKLVSIGVKLFSMADIDLSPINEQDIEVNKQIIKKNFSSDVLVSHLRRFL